MSDQDSWKFQTSHRDIATALEPETLALRLDFVTKIHHHCFTDVTDNYIVSFVLPEIASACGIESCFIRLVYSPQQPQQLTDWYCYSTNTGIRSIMGVEATEIPKGLPDRIATIFTHGAHVNESVSLPLENGCISVKLEANGTLYGHLVADTHIDEQSLLIPKIVDDLDFYAQICASLLHNHRTYQHNSIQKTRATLIQVLSKLSHDIKNPITGISGFAQIISNQAHDQSISDYCTIIQDSLIKVEHLVEDLYHIAKKIPLELTLCDFSLTHMLSGIVNLLYEQYKVCGIELRFHEHTKQDIQIHGDSALISKLLTVICMNAKEALPQGGSLDIELSKEERYILISIRDTGHGIPLSVQHYIGEPFFSFGKNRSPGLGLSMAKNIVESHGGTLSFESIEKKGSVFYIRLPIK